MAAKRARTAQPPAPPARKTQGKRVCEFIEKFCCHPDGALVGQPLVLHPFWRRLIYEMFEQEWDPATQTWRRKYSEAVVGLAKKSGKTAVLSAIGLYFLLADGDPSSYVISAAASEDQGSNLLYGGAKAMCKLSEPLKQLTLPSEKEILVPSLPRARMHNVTSKPGTNDGANARAVLADELHEWKGQRGRDLYTVLRGAIAARPNGMTIAITTAGFDRDSICYEKYEYGSKVQSGEIDDPRFFFRWLEAPPESDHRDPAVWRLANPLLGVTVPESYLEDRVKRETESVFRRYHLNNWVAAENIWIPYGVWDKGLDKTVDLDPALPLYVGIDLAKNIDSSAVAMVQRREVDGEQKYVARARIWENPYPIGHSLRESWRMNNNLIVELLRELFQQFPVAACTIDDEIKPGPCFAFDPWRFRAEAEKLQGEGLAMFEVPQSDSRMVPASQALYEAIMQGQILHDGDAGLKRHIHNVIADQRERGWRMSKPTGSPHKIDAAVALGIALWICQTTQAPDSGPSVYEERGLLLL